ncbi:hypothetical protein [Anaerosporobacter sp.]|nr:hypothetical protein [Anaerosporobacter sp.]
MQILYKAEINEEIYGGLDVIRNEINDTLRRFGFEVTDSQIETPEEVDSE